MIRHSYFNPIELLLIASVALWFMRVVVIAFDVLFVINTIKEEKRVLPNVSCTKRRMNGSRELDN